MASTGWTWDECLDQLDTPRMAALEAIWLRWPPVHKLLAAFIGYKAPEEQAKQYITPEVADRIIQSGGVFITGDMLGGPRGGQR